MADQPGGPSGPPSEAEQQRSDRWFDVERTIAFSDAVIAVAITLLVVTLDVPDVDNQELGSALADLGPKIIGFVASFWVIAGFWIQHHQFGKRLKAIDGRLMRINLFFLFAISLTSFGTALFGSYAANTLALTIYTFILIAVGSSMYWLWRYAYRHHLIEGEIASADRDPLASVVRTIIFLSAIPIGLLTPWAPLVWTLSPQSERIASGLRRLGGR
jgi:uncharacterized membrane protein